MAPIGENGTIDIFNHGISLMDPDFALTHTYQYEEKAPVSTIEFMRENLWLPILIVCGIFGIVLAFFFADRRKSKAYLEQEKAQLQAKAAEEAIVHSLASIYFTALEVEIESGLVRVIRIPDFMKDRFLVDGQVFSNLREPFLLNCVDPKFHEEVRRFLEYDSLVENVRKQGYIQKTYLGLTQGWCRITVVPVENDESDEIRKMVFAVANIDEEKTREERIRYQAEHDQLTGVLNRAAFSKLTEELSANDGTMALMVLDVDKFKLVNDQYGHDVGDEVLKHVAELLGKSFRQRDYVIRYGGDEFVVIFQGCRAGFAERIRDKITSINLILQNPSDDAMPPVTVSAGMRIFEEAYTDQIFKDADVALYHTKTHGRAGITIYEEGMESK